MGYSNHPVSLLVVNPQSKFYYAPPCLHCNSKDCENCPLEVSKDITLEDVLSKVVDPKKFRGNEALFTNQVDHRYDSDDNENDNMITTSYSIQQDDEGNSVKKHSGWRNFQLQFVFNNLVLKRSEKQFSSAIMSFDHHPR